MERDLAIMALFLVITQEILDRFKKGQRMSMQEKIVFFMFFARTVESWQRIVEHNATLPSGCDSYQKAIEDGRF